MKIIGAVFGMCNFFSQNVAQQIHVFFQNMFGNGKIEPKRFHDWILQFDESERLLACQIFDMVTFYDENDVRQMCLEVYRSKLPPEAKTKTVAFFGLGHGAKSGHHILYPFKQAISRLPSNERSFRDEEAFQDISKFNKRRVAKPSTVIFLDDFIGTGIQATKYYLASYFEGYKWLYNAEVYYCALVGFKDGIKHIKESLSGKIKDVLVYRELDDKDKAFSDKNPRWKSEEVRVFAEQWASEIGRQVLVGRSNYKPERDKLGLRDSQGLVIFSYNVPSNTLPLFWGDGNRNGRKWIPLQERYD